MLYVVHDDAGRISQANKVFEHAGYADVLRERGLLFVEMDKAPGGGHVFDIEGHYVKGGSLCERPDMPIEVSAAEIRADSKSASRIARIPKGATVTVMVAGMMLMQEVVNDGSVTIVANAPATYSITIERFPFRQARVQVVAR